MLRSLKWKLKELKFKTRVRINRAVHGYDQFDWWEYFSNNSARAVTLLTLLRDRGHGFRCMQEGEHDCWEGTCEKLWREALNDAIYFHSICAGDSMDRWDLNKPGHEDDLARFERGRKVYAEYYESLWD